MEKGFLRVTALFLAFLLCADTGLTAYAVPADTQQASAEQKEPQPVEKTVSGNEAAGGEDTVREMGQSGWDGITTQQIYECGKAKIIYTLDNTWKDGFSATVTIENMTDSAIHDWYLSMDSQNEITELWNAQLYSHENETYIIGNAGWNQDIPVGGHVEFGFNGAEGFAGFPMNYEFLGENEEVGTEAYEILYHLENDWDSGFTASVTIKNNSDEKLKDWTLEFDYDRTITNIWNGVIESHEGSHYIIRNAGYNSNIKAGGEITFGFNGKDGQKDDKPSNYRLYTHKVKKTEFHTVVFDLNYEGAENMPETQYVGNGECAVKPDKPERGDYDFLGWYTDTTYEEYFDFGTPVKKDTTLYACWVNLNDTTDSDSDGITDSLENVFGTDPYREDTDSDGITDYDEIDLFGYDPLQEDTDGNGIPDGEEDYDGDGLSNAAEIRKGTDPQKADTDKDGLTDGAEVFTYATDPAQADTDSDGVSDGKETEIGTDPLTAEDSFDITEYYEGEAKVRAGVTVTLLGEQVETLGVEPVENETLFPETIPGYIGEAYDFHVEGSFESAVLHFEFDPALLKEEDFDPVIYYYKEEEQMLEPLETDVDENTASTVVPHFSKYILINRTKYEAEKEWIDVWSTTDYKKIHMVIVIDDSQNMARYDKDNGRLDLARALIDSLPAQDSKIGILKYAQYPYWMNGVDGQADSARECLVESNFNASGMANTYFSLNTAFGRLKRADAATLQIIVLLGNGSESNLNYRDLVLKNAQTCNTKICVAGVGGATERFKKNMLPLVQQTGGIFQETATAEGLAEIYSTLAAKIDITTDSDGDGIPDYYEDNMFLFNRTRITMDKYNADTDGDGIPDGEEIELKYEYNEGHTKMYVYGKMNSNPSLADSDNDGLPDGAPVMMGENVIAPKDPAPLERNGHTGLWDAHIGQRREGGNPGTYTQDPLTVTVGGKEYTFPGGLDDRIPQELADVLVDTALLLRKGAESYMESGNREEVDKIRGVLRDVILIVKKGFDGDVAANASAFLCNFSYDSEKTAFHSHVDTWQRAFGYNRFYDEVFDFCSYMDYAPIKFTASNEEYVLWMWKGDYWGLQSGAEIGLYKSPKDTFGVDHYVSIDFEVPMTLALYNYRTGADIENVFSWVPEEKQWWVTGFNPNRKDADPEPMVTVGMVDFSERTELFDGLKEKINSNDITILQMKDVFIFDEDNHMVWIVWKDERVNGEDR